MPSILRGRARADRAERRVFVLAESPRNGALRLVGCDGESVLLSGASLPEQSSAAATLARDLGLLSPHQQQGMRSRRNERRRRLMRRRG